MTTEQHGSARTGSAPVRRARIGIVATDPLRLFGLETIVHGWAAGRDVEVVATSASGALGISELSLVLLDAGCTPHLLGLLAAFHRSRPHLKVMVVGDDADHDFIQRVIGAGAKGYVTYAASESEICMAIDVVQDGSVWAPRKVMARLLETPDGGRVSDSGVRQQRITDREMEVLRLLWEGRSNREIAKAMQIDEGTVKAHVGRLMRKMGVENRTALAIVAENLKLVGPRGAG